jgi:hypothetical protein
MQALGRRQDVVIWALDGLYDAPWGMVHPASAAPRLRVSAYRDHSPRGICLHLPPLQGLSVDESAIRIGDCHRPLSAAFSARTAPTVCRGGRNGGSDGRTSGAASGF